MRSVLMILSVFGVLTGCIAGVDQRLDSASEMRAAVGRSAHVLRETHEISRNAPSATATIASRAKQCLDDTWMSREDDGRVTFVAAVGNDVTPFVVFDLREEAGGTSVTVTRGLNTGHDTAAAVLAWAGGNTAPCPGH